MRNLIIALTMFVTAAVLILFSSTLEAQNLDPKAASLELNLTSAGTEQPLSATSLKVRYAIIHAADGNTGNVYLSPESGNANVGTSLELSPGENYLIAGPTLNRGYVHYDLKDWYWDGATTGNDITVIYFQ